MTQTSLHSFFDFAANDKVLVDREPPHPPAPSPLRRRRGVRKIL